MFDEEDDYGIVNPQLFRLKNAFDYQTPPFVPVNSPFGQMNEPMVRPPMEQIFQPSYERMNAYGEAADSMPIREEPSRARKIGAAIHSLAAIDRPELQLQLKDRALNRPFYEKMADWHAGLEPKYRAAQLEGQQNTNERVLFNEAERRRLEDRRIDDREEQTRINARKADETAHNNEENRKIRQQRVDLQKWRAENPDRKVQQDSEGYLISIHPKTGESEYVLDSEGEPVKGSRLTDAQKLGIQHKNRLSEIGATGNEARETENVRAINRENLEGVKQGNREKNIKSVYEGKKEVKETVPGSNQRTTTEKKLTPGQNRQEHLNRVNELQRIYPQLGQWVDVANGQPKVRQPSTGGMFSRGPSADEYERINKFIDEGKVKVRNQQGRSAWLPIAELEKAKAQGWIEVK